MKPLILNNQPLLTVSCPPHAHCGKTFEQQTRAFFLALLPAAAMAVFSLGFDALRVICLAVGTAMVAEFVSEILMERKAHLENWHAAFIGLCFAFLIPASAPWWLVVAGAGLSIIVGKMIFGGLGGNPLSPPLVGWAICSISWKVPMSAQMSMLGTRLDDPLALIKYTGPEILNNFTLTDLFLGHQLGGLGAVQIWAILGGGIFIIARGYVSWRIPVGFLGGVLGASVLFWMLSSQTFPSPLFHLLAGSTLFGAFFLATDAPSSPAWPLPMILFGILGGIMVVIIRVYGVYPDGVPFAILVANLFSPLLDKIRPKPFGHG